MVQELPVADGGQGTLDALVGAAGGTYRELRVDDPLGREIGAQWGLLSSRTAIVELAQASGYELLSDDERDPERTSSYGTGQLIRSALDAGVEEIMVGLGGSATTDGGLGALRALGARLLSEDGHELPGCGADLARLEAIDVTALDPRLATTQLRIIADVDNPLCGPRGAAAIFGPQKGADAQAVERLDAGLANLDAIMRRDHGQDVGTRAGAGAAGGVAAGLAGLAGAEIVPGAEAVLTAIGFDGALDGADLCITGEGALDLQTADGKAPAVVAERCRGRGVPCVAFCGRADLSPTQAREMGFAGVFPIAQSPRTLADAMAMTETDLQATGAALGAFLSALVVR